MEPGKRDQLFSLSETAEKLGVDTETLILWNENNILKPTITLSGVVGYREEQIEQFLQIQSLLKNNQIRKPEIVSANIALPTETPSRHKQFSGITVLVFLLSLSATLITANFILNSKPENKGKVTAMALQTDVLDPSGTIVNPLPAQRDTTNTDIQNNSPAVINELSANNVTYSETANFMPDKDAQNTVFDYRGNIKDKNPETDVLAATTFTNGSAINSVPVKQTVDLNLILGIFALGMIMIPFIFKKQPAYQANKPTNLTETLSTGFLTSPDEQKILEVNQKTDGTVVLNFQGQEYKVSKPEMDSESDQFIDRMMSLVTPGVKEIDYDSSLDSEVRLSTPLSKIVTRLGFVGIKRDLFFPRTSKNRVLFRRYLTHDDLASMNLSPEQIKSVFAVSN